MKTSDQINEISEALSKARDSFQDISKNKTATVKGETKAGKPYEYSYKYADLPEVFGAVNKSLSDNGLSITQGCDTGLVITRLIHKSGQWIETYYPMSVKDQTMQGLAAGWTYSRRQAINGILGVSSEEDTDGDHKKPQESQDRKLREPEKLKNAAPQLFMTDSRIKALFAVTKQAGWSEDQLRAFVKAQFGYDSMKSLKQQDFDLLMGHLHSKRGPMEEIK